MSDTLSASNGFLEAFTLADHSPWTKHAVKSAALPIVVHFLQRPQSIYLQYPSPSCRGMQNHSFSTVAAQSASCRGDQQ